MLATLDPPEAPARSGEYIPTPEEIRAACEAIRATWTEREHRRRAGLTEERYTIPRVRTGGRCSEPAT